MYQAAAAGSTSPLCRGCLLAYVVEHVRCVHWFSGQRRTACGALGQIGYSMLGGKLLNGQDHALIGQFLQLLYKVYM